MKSISFLEEVCLFDICSWEYRSKNCNHCSEIGCWIWKAWNMRPGPSLLLQHSDLQPVPPSFPWFLDQIHPWSVGGCPWHSPALPERHCLAHTLLGSTSGLSPCPAELDVQWPVIIKILITRGVDYEQSYFLGLERPTEFNKWLKNDLVFSSN